MIIKFFSSKKIVETIPFWEQEINKTWTLTQVNEDLSIFQANKKATETSVQTATWRIQQLKALQNDDDLQLCKLLTVCVFIEKIFMYSLRPSS
jgi:hypothetical protein